MSVVAKASTTNAKEIAAALRQRVLRLNPEDIGLKARPSLALPFAVSRTNDVNEVWGVVIETAHPDAVASLVVLADGSVSFYVSNGTGCIGCGSHREVRQDGAELLQIAAGALSLTVATDDTELPPPEVIRFYLLTREGLHCTQVRLEDINKVDDRLGRLYFCGQRVLAGIERVGAGQSLAQEIRMALNSRPETDTDPDPAGIEDRSRDNEQGDQLCLSVGNVVRRLRT